MGDNRGKKAENEDAPRAFQGVLEENRLGVACEIRFASCRASRLGEGYMGRGIGGMLLCRRNCVH